MKKANLLIMSILVIVLGLFIAGCPKNKETTDVNEPEVKAPAEKTEQSSAEK
jgi:hypothetical protein